MAVYGLGANAEDPAAVSRIFQVKRRPPSHPLIVHIGGAQHLGDWVQDVPETARLLAEHFWPGPLTLVLRRGRRVPLEATGGLETVAVRVPDHPVALALLSAFGGGVTAPSANRFGSVSPTTADHVRAELGDAVDFILDGGPCGVGVESTIVDVTGETPAILRPGGVTREDLEAVLQCPIEVPSTSHVRVPGQHPSHYAPSARVILVEQEKVVEEAQFAQEQGHQVGVLLPPVPRRHPGEGARHGGGPSVPGRLRARAVQLPARIRPAGVRPHRRLLAGGGGAGTGDRQLRRAAGPRSTT